MKSIASEPYTIPDGRTWRARLLTDGRVYRVEWFTPERRRQRQNVAAVDEADALAKFHKAVERLSSTVENRDVRRDSIENLCAYYTDVLQVARGDADATRKKNRVVLGKVAAWLATQGIVTVDDLADRPDMLPRLVAHLLEKYAPYTVAIRMTVFKAVFRGALDGGLIERVPGPAKWPTPKVPERIPRALSPGEVATVIEKSKGAPVHPVIVFLAHTGCRPSDVVGLRWQDVSEDCRTASFIQSKTKRSVQVNLVGAARTVVLEARLARTSEYVFPHRDGKPWKGNAAKMAISRACEVALGKHASAKQFRVAVVTLLLENGADQETVRLITGHRSESIEAYHQRSAKRTLELAELVSRALVTQT